MALSKNEDKFKQVTQNTLVCPCDLWSIKDETKENLHYGESEIEKMKLKIGPNEQMRMMVHILEPFKLMIIKSFIKKIKIAILWILTIIEKTRRKHNIITHAVPTQPSMYYFDNLPRIKIYTFIRNFSKIFKIFWCFFHIDTIFLRFFLHMYDDVHDLYVVSIKLKHVLSVIPEIAIIW